MTSSSSEFQVPKGLSFRPGGIDFGRDYEIKMAALFVLKCIRNSDILNMWMVTNVTDCGDFDDIVLYIATSQQKHITYLMQLKHKMDSSDAIKVSEFKKEKGDFSIKKYFESLKRIKQKILDQNYTESAIINHLRDNQETTLFILYTNRGMTKNEFLNCVNKNSKIDKKWMLYKMLDTNDGFVSRFDYKKMGFKCERGYGNLMDKLFLCTKQKHVNKLDAEITKELSEFLGKVTLSKQTTAELVQQYIQFFSDWYKGNLGGCYAITKEHISKVLLGNIIMPYLKRISNEDIQNNITNYSYDVWNEIMIEKSVTVIQIDELVNDFVIGYISKAARSYCNSSENKKLWKIHSDSVSRFILRVVSRSKEVKESEAYELLWKTKMIPVLLHAESSAELRSLIKLLQLFPNVFLVIILVKEPIRLQNSNNLFIDLTNAGSKVQSIILNHPILLQRRVSMKLTQILTENYLHYISVKDIIYILNNKFSVGSEFIPPSDLFIERTLEAVWLKPEVLMEKIDEIFVIQCYREEEEEAEEEDFSVLHQLKLHNYEVFYWNNNIAVDYKSCGIIIIKDDSSLEKIEEWAAVNNTNYHYLILHEGQYLQWVRSYGTVKHIKSFRKLSGLKDYELNFKKPVLTSCLNKTTLISGCPGMGKSLLLDYISCNFSENMWMLKVNLYQHSINFKSSNYNDSKEFLRYFFNENFKNIKNPDLVELMFEMLLESKKVILLLDGFDEVPVFRREKVLDMVKIITNSNYLIYITTRPNLKSNLEEELDTFGITINPFTKSDQTIFLTKFFSRTCGQKYSKPICEFVEKLLESSKRNLNNRDVEFTGIPLQTHLLAEVFTEQCRSFIQTAGQLECESFDLVYLYEHFINEKVKIVSDKYGGLSEDTFHYYKTFRTLYALKLLFTADDLMDLNIEQRINEGKHFPGFLNDIQKDGIVFVDDGTNVVFVHRTFAEYLTAEWLASNVLVNGENQNVTKRLLNKIFDPSFDTIRNIFDRILAKDCPLHLAIINRQVATVKDLISKPKHLLRTDKGNRTILHLMASWGVYHPPDIDVERPWEIEDLQEIAMEDPMTRILQLLPDMKITLVKENLLGFTQLDYALASRSLNIAEEICVRLTGYVHECATLSYIDEQYVKRFFYISLNYILLKYSLTTMLMDIIKQRRSKLNEDYKFHNQVVQGNIDNMPSIIYLKKCLNKTDNMGFTPLHIAAMFGHDLILHSLIANNADVNVKDTEGRTPLHWATIRGENNIISALLDSNADINAIDSKQMTALHYAIVVDFENRYETVAILLRYKPNITLQDLHYDNTVLHFALHYNEVNIFKLLLHFSATINEKGKNIENDYLQTVLSSRDRNGRTVLHWAAYKGLADIVNLLLSYGIIADIQDKDGKTPMHWAAESGYADLITTLLHNNANIDVKDVHEATPLHLAVSKCNTDIVKLLLNQTIANINVNAKDINGQTPFHIAVKGGSTDIIKLLLGQTECKIDIDAKDNHGQTPLYLAIKSGNTNIVRLLVDQTAHKIDINVKSNDASTPLHFAVRKGNTDIVKLLLDLTAHKVDVNSKGTYFERTPLHEAVSNGYTDIVKLLLYQTDHEIDINAKDNRQATPLYLAVEQSSIEIVKLLLEQTVYKVDINAKERYSERTPLHEAVRNDKIIIVKLLLDQIIHEIDINAKDNDGSTPLHLAARNGYTDIAKFLFGQTVYNIDINTKDNDGSTPLHIVARNGNTYMVELLLHQTIDKLDINATDNSGSTPLHFAVKYGNVDIFKLFLDQTVFKVNINARDSGGWTPIDYAIQNSNIDIFKLLINQTYCTFSINGIDKYTRLPLAIKRNQTDIVKLLLNQTVHSIDVNVNDVEGYTPLHLAILFGNRKIVKMLLGQTNHKVDVNATDDAGCTPLHLSVSNGSRYITKLLLDQTIYEVDINAKNYDRLTPLHLAAKRGNADITNLLLDHLIHLAIKRGNTDTAKLLLDQTVHNIDNSAQGDDGSKRLYFAAESGNTGIVKLFLDEAGDNDINAKNTDGPTPLHFAVRNGYTNIVKLLLAKTVPKIDLNAKDDDGWTPLHAAVGSGNTTIVKLLLDQVDHTIDKNVTNTCQSSPLHLAVEHGNTNIVKLLLEHNVDINVKDTDGWTPLHLAAEKGSIDIIKLLLDVVVDRKVDINAKDSNGCTPIHLFVRYGNAHIVKLLLDKTAYNIDINAKDNEERTPLHFAAVYGYTNIVKLLLNHRSKLSNGSNDGLFIPNKVKLEESDKYGMTALHYACIEGHLDTVSTLLLHGANVEALDKENKTPSLMHDSTDTAKLLLDQTVHKINTSAQGKDVLKPLQFTGKLLLDETVHNVDINVKNSDGSTPLHFAVEYGHTNIVKLLLDRTTLKVDLNAKDDAGWTPLHFAVGSDNTDIVKLLLDQIVHTIDINATNKCQSTPLHLAIEHGNIDIIKLLLDYSAYTIDINVKDSNACTPLHLAVKYCNRNIVKLLLDQTVHKVDINAKGYYGRTPLHFAVKFANTDIVELLLDQIAHKVVSAKDDYESTPLHLAVKYGNINIVKLLLKHNANINVKDIDGSTPFHLAVEKGSKDIIKLLLDVVRVHKVINAKDNNGRTPLHLSVRYGDAHIVELMLDKTAHKIDINAKDNEEWTPLHFAAVYGYTNVVELLLSHRRKFSHGSNDGLLISNEVKLDESDKNDMTALHYACKEGHLDTVNTLLLHGANIKALDKDNNTPLMHATNNQKSNIIDLLVAFRANVKGDDTMS